MNAWKLFETLVASGGPIYVGEVTAVGGVMVTVTTIPGSTTITASGPGRTLAIGQRWLIQDGRIIDEAPSGTVYTAEI